MDTKRIIKYHEQLYGHNFDNLEAIPSKEFLDRHNLPVLMQREMNYLNKPMSIFKIGSIINNLPKQKAQGIDGFTGEFYQTFKKQMHQFFFLIN